MINICIWSTFVEDKAIKCSKNITNTSKNTQQRTRNSILSHACYFIFPTRMVQYFPSWGDNFTSTAFRTIGTNGTIDVKIWQAVRQVLASCACKYAYREYAHNERRKEEESAEAFLESQAARAVVVKAASY